MQWTPWHLCGGVRSGFGLLLALLLLGVGGCRDNVQLPSRGRLLEFENAGPSSVAVDVERLVRARVHKGPYRTNFGDVLEMDMPTTLFPEQLAAGGASVTHTCRVSAEGMITLPDGRQLSVVDKTAGEIEPLVVDAYYPELVRTRPSVYVKVLEYRTYRLQIVGAVATPGIYQLRHDQMSLVSLLMQAGGISEAGAARIRIERANPAQTKSVRQAVSRSASRSGVAGEAVYLEADADRVPGRASALSGRGIVLQFDPEGPLVTTGWLRVLKNGTLIVDRWLDILNEPQRRAALEDAAEPLAPPTMASVHRRLLLLGQTLESRAERTPRLAAFVAPADGWQRTNGGQYAALAAAPQTDGLAGGGELDGTADAGGPETPWYATEGDADTTVIMPVRGLNVPFTDVALAEGDTVFVERLKPKWLSVLGLVNAPGNFPYPPESDYRLGDALALAGGLNLVAEPRYVCVYRLGVDGQVVGVTFQLVNPKNQETLTQQLALKVKPGDVISVEHTPRTRANLFFDRVFRVSLGLYLNPEEIWE